VSRRRRQAAGGDHGGGGGHGGGDERWMASYMDMVTVLMCLFIVLYAMSTIDQNKFEKLRFALSTGFGQVASKTVDTASGVVVPPNLVDKKGNGFAAQADVAEAVKEVNDLKAMEEAIQASLQAHGVADKVGFDIDQRGLTIKLIGTQTFFGGNSATLQPSSQAIIDSIAPVIGASTNQISVEGHADVHGSPTPFVSDWDLSTSRATSVLRRFVDADGIAGARMSATGYGSSRPASTDPNDMAANRRVDIVILSDKSEDIRKLIPGILDGSVDPNQAVDPATGKNVSPADATTKPAEGSASTTSTTSHDTQKGGAQH
jgi:chemotaxis protein MotB